MAFADTIADDLLIVDDPRTISYYPRTSGDTYGSPVTITHAIRRAVMSDNQLAAGLILPIGAVTWHCRVSDVPNHNPGCGDKIVEADGTLWLVDRVTTGGEGTHYRFECKPEAE